MTALRRFVNRIKDTASEKKKKRKRNKIKRNIAHALNTRSRERRRRKSFRVFRESRRTIKGEAGSGGKISFRSIRNAMISKNESEIWRNPRESSSRVFSCSPLPPARIFLCHDVGGRGKKRASLCYEGKT